MLEKDSSKKINHCKPKPISLSPQIFCLHFCLHFAEWLKKPYKWIVKRKGYLLELWLLFLFTRATLRKEFLHTGFLINFTSKFQYTVFTLAWVKKPKTTKQIVRVPLVLASTESKILLHRNYIGYMVVLLQLSRQWAALPQQWLNFLDSTVVRWLYWALPPGSH